MKLLPLDMSAYNGAFYPEFDPLVIFDEGGIHKPFLKVIINEMEKSPKTESGVYSTSQSETVNHYYRSSLHCFINEQLYESVKNRLDFVIDWQMSQQKGKHQYILAERLQFLRYDDVQLGKFLSHTDNAYFDETGKFLYTAPQRVVSMVTYLNDDFEGGELVFSNIHDDNNNPLVYKPKPGTTVLFPSDLRYPHEVRPVTKGVRYCIVGWYNIEYNPE